MTSVTKEGCETCDNWMEPTKDSGGCLEGLTPSVGCEGCPRYFPKRVLIIDRSLENGVLIINGQEKNETQNG